MHKAGEVRFTQPVVRPPVISGTVDKDLVEAVIAGGVRRDQVVADIKQLHPFEAGVAFVNDGDQWAQQPSGSDEVLSYELFGPLEIPHAGEQTVSFDTRSGETLLLTTDGRFSQAIVMDENGRVTENTGKHPVARRKLMGN